MKTLGEARLAIIDLCGSFAQYRLWAFLGFSDIVKLYRRSFLGPLWITINTGVFVLIFSLVGSQLFNQDVRSYAAYFCTGFIVFGFLTTIITEGCQCFISAEGYLKHAYVNKMIFPLQLVTRNFIILGHNFAVILAVLIWTDSLGDIDISRLLLVLALVFINGVLLAAVLGAVSARFRDIPLIVSTVLQTLFFLTPVIWRPEQLSERAQFIVYLNPIATFLEAIRCALLGIEWRNHVIIGLSCITLLTCILWIGVFSHCRRRIAFWV